MKKGTQEYLEYQRQYRIAHKEEIRKKDRERYQNNKEYYNDYQKEYRKKNRERLRELYRKNYVPKKKDYSNNLPLSEDIFEVWKDINEYYMVSNYGKVWSKKRNGLVGHKNGAGYMEVIIDGKSYLIHRLIAEAFIPNPDNLPEIDHLDTNRTNNVWTNLRWTDRKGNQNNPITKEKFKESNKGKLSEKVWSATKIRKMKPVLQYTLNGEFVKEYDSAKTAEIETGIGRLRIGACCRNYRGAKTAGGFIWKFKEAA